MQPQPMTNPTTTLWLSRLLWAALLAGPLMFTVVVAFMVSTATRPAQPMQFLFTIAVGLLATMIPAGYFLRSQIYKRGWHDDVISPQAYFTGNLLLWACCEMVAFVGLIGVLLNATFWPYVIPSIAAMAVHVINFPHGRLMFPDALHSGESQKL